MYEIFRWSRNLSVFLSVILLCSALFLGALTGCSSEPGDTNGLDPDAGLDADDGPDADVDPDAHSDADLDADDPDPDAGPDADDPDADVDPELSVFADGQARQDLDDDDEPVSKLTFEFGCEPECEILECTLELDGQLEETISDCASPHVELVTQEGEWTFTVSAENEGLVEEAQAQVTSSLAPFVSTWNTSTFAPASSANDQIRLPLVEDGDYRFLVDWGDGTQDVIDTWDQGEVTKTYEDEGEVTISIQGRIEGWVFADEGDRRKLEQISQWGALRLGNSEEGYFRGAVNLDITATDAPDLEGTTTLARAFEDTRFTFFNPANSPLNDWDVSGVTDMHRLFAEAPDFNSNLDQWDVSNVTDMSEIFYGASSFNGDIGTWDLRSVVTMQGMLRNANSFDQELDEWDVSNVEDMSHLFNGASSFDGDINDWDVSNVTTMSHMFANATTFNHSLADWDVSNVTDMSRMFYRSNATALNPSAWDVTSVVDMSGMFRQVNDLNPNVVPWDVSNVENMSELLNRSGFNRDISEWDVSNVTDMSGLFAYSPFDRDISEWDVSNVEDMSNMFRDTHFNQDIGGWDTSSVTNMSSMFRDSLFNQDIGDWDTSSVESMAGMFAVHISKPFDDDLYHAFNQDISGWDTSNVTNMSNMFERATQFDQDLSEWDISSVTTMWGMFMFNELSTANYNALLESFAAQNVQNDVAFDGGFSNATGAGATARSFLVDTFNWTIFDGDGDHYPF